MIGRLAEEILSHSTMAVLRALSERACGVREVADLCGLSPRGSSLVLHRLVVAGLAERTGQAYSAALSADDAEILRILVGAAEKTELRRRAGDLSAGAKRSVQWIDGTLGKLQQVRKRYRGADRTS
ncbi:MAG: hypothetical protein V1495_08220 [Pseudomonadota bacterium]